jgi:hypothetical protein
MLAGVAAAVRLLASLTGLAALAAHHATIGIVLVLVVLVLVATVTVATVTGVIGHLYMYHTFLIILRQANNLTQPYLQSVRQMR